MAGGERQRDARAAWLEACCVAFVLLGALLPVAYGSPAFAAWRAGLESLVGRDEVASARPTLDLLLGITGGSIAGKWVVHLALVRFGIRRRLRWARDASLAGLVAWFALDSAVSIARGALFNVIWVNLLPLVVFGAPLALGGSRDVRVLPPIETPPRLRRASRVLLAALVLGAGSGFVIALGGETILFAPWREGLSAAHFGGQTIPPATSEAALVFFGPIGGAVLGQFVLLAMIARHAIPRGEPWAWKACAASIGAWFLIDTGWDLVHGGLFNVLMVNVPTLLLTVPPLAWVALETRAARAQIAAAAARGSV